MWDVQEPPVAPRRRGGIERDLIVGVPLAPAFAVLDQAVAIENGMDGADRRRNLNGQLIGLAIRPS